MFLSALFEWSTIFFFILKHCFCPKIELTHLFFKVRSLIFKNALYRGGGYKDYDCTLSTSGCWDPPPPYKSINASILNRYIKACGFHTYNMKILFYLDSLRAKMHIKLLRFGLLWWYSIPFFLSHRCLLTNVMITYNCCKLGALFEFSETAFKS